MSSERLPRFERPPVVETVLGVQYAQLPRLGNAHLGAFWKELGPDWPIVIDAPPLRQQFERFGDLTSWSDTALQLELVRSFGVRLQIRNGTGDRMIQIQNGRLNYNWLGHEGGNYPRYDKVRPEFDAVLEQFEGFVAERQLGQFEPHQWEVTYVNHIPKGSLWNDPRDWAGLFRATIAPPPDPEPLRLEGFVGEWHYEIASRRGRLHVQMKHARREGTDGEELLVLTLTARGPIELDDRRRISLDEGLNLGRETIVRAFHDLTPDSAHDYWGLVRENV